MKKLFLSLFVGLFGLISFCSSGSYTYEGTVNGNIILPVPQNYISKNFTLHCTFYCNWNGNSKFTLNTSYYYGESYQATTSQIITTRFDCMSNYNYDYNFSNFNSGPTPIGIAVVYFNNITNYDTVNYSCTFSGDNIISVPTCSPQYTSEECQSEYGLVSSGVLSECQSNLESCQLSISGYNNTLNNCTNNLNSCTTNLSNCLQSNCPVDTGNIQRSALYINQIQHLGGPVINIDIPDNVYWDYTTSDEEFNLYVGSGYDQDYIDGIISINSYSPTSEDFTNVFVSGLTLIMPYIIFSLFIVFLWKLIKRIKAYF